MKLSFLKRVLSDFPHHHSSFQYFAQIEACWTSLSILVDIFHSNNFWFIKLLKIFNDLITSVERFPNIFKASMLGRFLFYGEINVFFGIKDYQENLTFFWKIYFRNVNISVKF